MKKVNKSEFKTTEQYFKENYDLLKSDRALKL